MDRLELAQKEAELLEAGIPYAAVTLVESSGTARTEGKMLVLSADTIFGTIGGGAGEQLAHRDALSLLAEGIAAGKQAEAEGREYHPAANAAFDRLTDGYSSQIQFESICANALLAARLTGER